MAKRDRDFENLSSFEVANDLESQQTVGWGQNSNTERPALFSQEMELIDALLKDEDATVKSRVLEFILKVDIKPHDKEFFCLFIALGWVHSMLIDAPENIKQIFTEIELHLVEWEQTNLKILKQLASKTENLALLADSSVKLSNSLAELIELCSGLSISLRNSESKQINWEQNWILLKEQLNQTKQSLEVIAHYQNQQILPALEKLTTHQLDRGNFSGNIQSPNYLQNKKTKKRTSWKGNLLIVISIFNLLIAGITLSVAISTQTAIDRNITLLEETKQINEWLLAKQNRRDCRDRILSANNPLCQN